MGQHAVCFVSNLGAPNFDGLSSRVPSKTAAILRVCRYKYDYYYYCFCFYYHCYHYYCYDYYCKSYDYYYYCYCYHIIKTMFRISPSNTCHVTVSPGAPTVLPDAVSKQSQECKALASRDWGKWEDCGAIYIIQCCIYNI